MAEVLLISAGSGEVRHALVRDGRLVDYAVEPAGAPSLVGNVYAGRITRVAPGPRAAFVDCGLDRSAFLPLEDVNLFEGQSLPVQVVSDPVADKGARVTTRLALAGRLLVLCAGGGAITVSRRIADAAERGRLERLVAEMARPDGAGIVVRTLAEGADEAALAADLAALVEAWAGLSERGARAASPALLHQEPGPVERALREAAAPAIEQVVVDDRAALAAARAYCRRAAPALKARLALHAAPEPLFARYGIDDEVASLLDARVALKSGAAITIERTRALVAVDVDSAGAAGAAGRALAVNLEAAAEIARQLRLRSIGGLVVIDFIGMAGEGARARVMAALGDALAADPAPVRIAPMSEFGVVELTRKRVRPALAELLCAPCPACAGVGLVERARRGAEVVRAAAPGRAPS
ncbi:MAG TPA: Rne/Rng family ribonuclease [Kiloniellales bacterium]